MILFVPLDTRRALVDLLRGEAAVVEAEHEILVRRLRFQQLISISNHPMPSSTSKTWSRRQLQDRLLANIHLLDHQPNLNLNWLVIISPRLSLTTFLARARTEWKLAMQDRVAESGEVKNKRRMSRHLVKAVSTMATAVGSVDEVVDAADSEVEATVEMASPEEDEGAIAAAVMRRPSCHNFDLGALNLLGHEMELFALYQNFLAKRISFQLRTKAT
jgi:hypothetical protein